MRNFFFRILKLCAEPALIIALLGFGYAYAQEAYVANLVIGGSGTGSGGGLAVIDMSDNKVVTNIPVNVYGPGYVVSSPDGTKMYTTSYNNGTSFYFSVISTATNKVIKNTLLQGGDADDHIMAINPAGTRAYVLFFPINNPNIESIYVVDTATSTVLDTINLPAGFIAMI